MPAKTPQQKKFKEATNSCIKEVNSWGEFGKCMRRKLGGKAKGKK